MEASSSRLIRTPDQRLRVFVSSTLQELAEERTAAREAIAQLRLAPVMFELGARPHPPQELYRAYLDQSHIFIGIYWQKYGWVAPEMTLSGLEDEYNLSGDKPKLIYVKAPAPEREVRLHALLDRIRADDRVSYKPFAAAAELRDLIENDLALLLTEGFEAAARPQVEAAPQATPPTNVPIPRNPLIGRERELQTACASLLRDDIYLVTLTGTGGTGKSRLTLEIALQLRADFPDVVFLVRLSIVKSHTRVVAAIADALDLREASGGQPLTDALIDHLREKRLLLILDSYERVMAAISLVIQLLEACPWLKILVTSRMALHVRAEKELSIPPLALPVRRTTLSLEQVSQSAAVQLFVQRAQSVNSEFALTSKNAALIAEICQRLDGLPLALELAAARTRLLSPPMLLARLEHRLELLRGGTRDLPARQHTLRSAIDWSYDLLNENARLLFCRLAVFVGGCRLEDADAKTRISTAWPERSAIWAMCCVIRDNMNRPWKCSIKVWPSCAP